MVVMESSPPAPPPLAAPPPLDPPSSLPPPPGSPSSSVAMAAAAAAAAATAAAGRSWYDIPNGPHPGGTLGHPQEQPPQQHDVLPHPPPQEQQPQPHGAPHHQPPPSNEEIDAYFKQAGSSSAAYFSQMQNAAVAAAYSNGKDISLPLLEIGYGKPISLFFSNILSSFKLEIEWFPSSFIIYTSTL